MKTLKVESPRFGTLVVEASRIIEFPRGLPGFENCKRFSLFHPEGEKPNFFILQSLDDAAIDFHITDAAQFGFGYEIVLSDEEAADLQIDNAGRQVVESAANSGTPLVVAVILSKEAPGQPVQANPHGPLVMNLDTRRGLQHVFARLDYNVCPA